MCWETITVSKQLISLHKSPITCDRQNCNHVFKKGEKVTKRTGRKNRYFCPECADKLFIVC